MAKDNDDRDHKVLQSIRGMLFFGVPNQGMKIDHLTSMVQGKPNERLIRSLDPESNSLRRLHDDFCEAAPTYSEVYSFFETMTSRIAITVSVVSLRSPTSFDTYELVRSIMKSSGGRTKNY